MQLHLQNVDDIAAADTQYEQYALSPLMEVMLKAREAVKRMEVIMNLILLV